MGYMVLRVVRKTMKRLTVVTLVRVTVAVMKYHDLNLVGKERGSLAYTSLKGRCLLACSS